VSRTINYLAGISAWLVLAAAAWGISGNITQNTTWSGTVDVDGDIVVSDGVLTIDPGTKISIASSDQANLWTDTTKICILIRDGGVISAAGTETDPITFTSAATTPAKGDWTGIITRYCTNEASILFKHCIIEYASSGFHGGGWSDSLSWVEPSGLTIEHSIIRHVSGVGIYSSSDAVMKCYNTTIHDCDGIIFWHGIKSGDIKYLTAYDASHGLVFPGADKSVGGNVITVDHLTLYNIDMMRTSNPKWWTGYGVYQCNDPGTLTLKNSILIQSTLANVKCSANWSITLDYNIYYTGLMGLMNLEGCTAGTNDLEVDPQVVDYAGYDFRLTAGSPGVSSAGDSEHRGAWQGTPVTVAINGDLVRNLGPGIRTELLYSEQGSVLEISLDQPRAVKVALYSTDGQVHTVTEQAAWNTGIHKIALDQGNLSGLYVIACHIGDKTTYYKTTIIR
jgi:hypothetical protein